MCPGPDSEAVVRVVPTLLLIVVALLAKKGFLVEAWAAERGKGCVAGLGHELSSVFAMSVSCDKLICVQHALSAAVPIIHTSFDHQGKNSMEGCLKGFVLHCDDKEDERTNAANDGLPSQRYLRLHCFRCSPLIRQRCVESKRETEKLENGSEKNTTMQHSSSRFRIKVACRSFPNPMLRREKGCWNL